MKVLVIRNAFTYDFGGAERLAVHIARELNLLQADAIVVSRQPRLLTFAEEQRVPYRRGWWWSRQNWSGLSSLLFPAYLAWQLCLFFWYIQLLLRLRPNALHILSKDDFIAGTFAGKILGKRVVWTDPADLKHVFAKHKVWYKNPVGKLVFCASKFADVITLVSDSERRLIEASTGVLSKKFVVIRIAGKDEKVTARERNASDKNAVVFCSTSRLVEAKGIGELIEAFNLLPAKELENYRLWLIGDGPDESRFKKLAAGSTHITFIGHSNEPLTYVAAADVFVHPTHHEGFSLSLAEAAMLGKPMIATNVGGNPELVNTDNGVLVPVHDPQALALAIIKLGSNSKLRTRLGKQARHDYVENIDFSRVIKDKIVPLYEKS